MANRIRCTVFGGLFLGVACTLSGPLALAQTFPAKPVRLVVPFAPGGATDIVARTIAAEMSKTLGQPVVVENRAGNAGAVGADLVAKSPPDGYMLCLCTVGGLVTIPLLQPGLSYSPTRDLAPVSQVNDVELGIFARETLGASTLPQVIALAKSSSKRISIATPGSGSPNNLAVELLKITAKVDLLHVPYKGDGQAILGLLSGDVDLYLGGIATALPQVRAGKIKPIAGTGTQRSRLLPDVPTVAESGFPGYDATVFAGIVVAAGTPAAIIDKLQKSIAAAVALPSVRTTFDTQGVVPVGSTAEAFAQVIVRNTEKWSRVLKEIGGKLD